MEVLWCRLQTTTMPCSQNKDLNGEIREETTLQERTGVVDVEWVSRCFLMVHPKAQTVVVVVVVLLLL